MEADSRLAALASDKSSYVFQSTGGPVDVTVTLIYRRAYMEMMAQKKWASSDVVIAQQNIKP